MTTDRDLNPHLRFTSLNVESQNLASRQNIIWCLPSSFTPKVQL
jgi:hypothetical protein